MLVLMFLGLAAGIFNVMQLSKDIQRQIDEEDGTDKDPQGSGQDGVNRGWRTFAARAIRNPSA